MNFIERVLRAHPSRFGATLESGQLQVLLAEPRRDSDGRLFLLRHGFQADKEYFYPASAIKLCAAVAALQKVSKLHQLSDGGINFSSCTPLSFYPLFPGDEYTSVDTTNKDDQKITLIQEIRKMFLVSDNVAFNRLFSLLGHRYLNEAMWALGLKSVHLQHKLSVPMSPEDNRKSEPLEVGGGREGSFCLPPKMSHLVVPKGGNIPGLHIGTAYIDEEGRRVEGPMDFSGKNRISLKELQDLLTKVTRPDIDVGGKTIEMEENLRLLLLEAMSQYPKNSRNPKYDGKEYPDDYCKFFLPGLCRVRPKESLRIYNKIGQAYGFTIENSYVLDIETGRDFFLSMVMYNNKNGVLNDDKYEYETAYRVSADLAEVMARAIWQYPPEHSLSATCLDCIPSSFWENDNDSDKEEVKNLNVSVDQYEGLKGSLEVCDASGTSNSLVGVESVPTTDLNTERREEVDDECDVLSLSLEANALTTSQFVNSVRENGPPSISTSMESTDEDLSFQSEIGKASLNNTPPLQYYRVKQTELDVDAIVQNIVPDTQNAVEVESIRGLQPRAPLPCYRYFLEG